MESRWKLKFTEPKRQMNKGTILILAAALVFVSSGLGFAEQEHECDKFAGESETYQNGDPLGRLAFPGILPNIAIPACRDAVAAFPGIDRYKFQLARALHAKGTSEAIAEAIGWYERIAAKGNTEAMYHLGRIHDLDRNNSNAAEAVRRYHSTAATLGFAPSMYELSLLLSRDGTQSHLALEWLQRAAKAGSGSAMDSLGSKYLRGKLVDKDPSEAHRWFRLGAEAGNGYAMSALANSYSKGIGVQKSAELAMYWQERADFLSYGYAAFLSILKHDAGRYGVPVKPKNAAIAFYYPLRDLSDQPDIKFMTQVVLEKANKMLSTEFKSEVQKFMKDGGQYDGPINGEFDDLTRNSILKMAKLEPLAVGSKLQDHTLKNAAHESASSAIANGLLEANEDDEFDDF